MTRRQALVVILVIVTAGILQSRLPSEDSIMRIDQQVCYEDQPCWDCATMGNQLCDR